MTAFTTLVEYESHPAFEPYVQHSNSVDTSVLHQLFAEIDAAMSVVQKSEIYHSEGFLQRHISAQIDPFLVEISKITQASMPSNAWFHDVVPAALHRVRENLYKMLVFENEKKQSVYQVTHSPLTTQVYNDLSNKGVSFQSLPQEYIQMVYQHLTEKRAEMERKVQEDPTKLHSLPLEREGPYWQITNELLKAYGIFDGATQYAQHQLEVIYVALGLSCSSQNWFRDCYSDVGVPTSKLAYLHYDHDFDIIKILMYLNPVDIKNGPFRIIPESSKWIASHTQSLFFKQLDTSTGEKIKRVRQDLDGYYRPVFKDVELRKEFMKLPRELRGTSHFGDDVLDNTSLSDRLLLNEVPLLSESANCAVFLGAETLHRGGLTEEGQRWAFQIALRKVGVGCGSA